MTLREFLDINYQNLLKGYGYEEPEVYDKNWNLITLWFGDDDPRYQSKILRIQPFHNDSEINRVRVVIDYDCREGD